MMESTELSGYSIQIAGRREFDLRQLHVMYQFRAKVFRRRLGWDVGLLGEMEIDAYDALDPVYLMMRDEAGAVRGCLRMLPTTGPYMLKDAFPGLLQGLQPPSSENIIELSRFAVNASVRSGFGFSSLTSRVIAEAIGYGFRQGFEKYLTVTTPAVERLLTRSGLQLQRLGSPGKVGEEQAQALIIDIPSSHLALVPRRGGKTES